jgi:Pvc16 N-terminal domain
MAGSGAVLSVGNSLVAYLTAVNELARAAKENVQASFQLVSSAEIADVATPEAGATITFWLYRLGVDPFLRNRPATPRSGAGPVFPLGLDLHYLVTAWAANAAREHEALEWVMRALYQHPILDRSVLAPIDVWRADEAVHLVATELSTEDMMRIWDAIRPEYRLSVTWCARVVRLDRDALGESGRPVVASRFAFGRPEPAEATDG